jgi:AcrR family transcriptional regulator
MPRVHAEHLSARRQQILDAAETCFSRNGFHKTTMQEIIKESGLSAGAIYNYFNSKEEIIESIAQERHNSELEAIENLTADATLSDALQSLAQSFTQELLTEPGVQRRRVSVLAWSEALLNPRVAESVQDGLDGPRLALGDVIRNSSLHSHLQPDAVARMCVAIFHGFVLQMLWDPETPHREMMRVFDQFVRTISTLPDIDAADA